MTHRLHIAALATAATLFLAPVQPVAAQSFTPQQRGEIETIVKDYLLKHP
jgi:hypothetical protein